MGRLEEEEDQERAAVIHWEELAVANDAVTEEGSPPLAPTVGQALVALPGPSRDMRAVPLVYGMQGSVRVWMSLVRLAAPYLTDVVISWNETDPQEIDRSKERFLALLASVQWNDIDFMI